MRSILFSALLVLPLTVGCTSGEPKELTDSNPPGDDDDDTSPGDDDDTSGYDDDTSPGDDDDDDTTPGDDDDDTTATGETGLGTGPDADSDGYESPEDCDDTDPLRYPGAPERCNGLDDDCDGSPLPDEVDADADGITDCAACDEAGFWLSTRELSGSALETEVASLVASHTCLDYSVAREFLFAQLDNDGGTIRCVYTGKTRSGVGAGFNDWEDMNTEHTWPRSQGAETEPEECDLHHLFITDALTNSQRGSYPFGIVQNDTLSILNVSGDQARLGTDSSGTTVFEPPDEHKGNVARALTYFAHRYGYTLSASELALYQSWHSADPPDEAEVLRSQAIGAEQGVPNPYVVCPSLLPEL